MFERQSVLTHVLQHPGRDGVNGRRSLRIGESRGWALVQVAGSGSEFSSAMRSALGVDPPARVGDVVRSEGRGVLKTGADQYWIMAGHDDDILSVLQNAMTTQLGAITSLSHSRTCIFVEGAAARSLLAKGVPLDFHPERFGVDQFALTGLHHSPVLIHRSGENRYELYALRTFALSVWEWIIDAALPFGYEIAAQADV